LFELFGLSDFLRFLCLSPPPGLRCDQFCGYSVPLLSGGELLLAMVSKVTAFLFLVSVGALSVGAGSATAYAQQRGETLAHAAEELISKVKETHYRHETEIDTATGVYNLDCSGFVDFLLKEFAPRQFAELPVEPGHTRPRAAIYYELIHGLTEHPLPGWVPVQELADAQPGDIIAWELSAPAPSDSGHVAIVAETPLQVAPDLYQVTVYDSSRIRHDNDTRAKGTSGVGRGTITIRIDPSGKPIEFRFNSHVHFHSEPIAIGRVVLE
jgi:hypothetical protein